MSHAIYIGRFRPFHVGHLSTITQAFNDLNLDQMTVLVGSCNRHRSVNNPFTFDEVRDMIKRSLPTELLDEVHVKSLYDHSNDNVWATEVRTKAKCVTHIVGYDKDESSYYLKLFPELKHYQPKPIDLAGKVVSATDIRACYFSEVLMNGPLSVVLPQGTKEFLAEWSQTETFTDMKAEYDSSVREINKFLDYPYAGHLNIACADNVVTCAGHVLLGTRKNNPGKNCLALPGGHKADNETFLTAALRELKEETCLKVPEKVLRGSIKAERMFDDPKRSYPHTRITMAYHIDIEPDNDGKFPRIKPADDLIKVEWVPLSEVRELQHLMYDDHYQIIQHFTGIY